MSYSICVFCGARPGIDDAYGEAADTFGRELAARDITVVYGGGRVGLMGTVADGALDAGGRVVGVIPDFLTSREVLHEGLTEQVVVDDLFERKAIMIERADAF
ncbi:MAG: TIGR00730 family Rossman fold protein, partial [Gammaproteobacteria bacterium]